MIPLSHLHPTFKEPVSEIDDTALNSWKLNQLADADASLTEAIRNSRSPSHHALASRALVRARLLQWDQAISDAAEVSLHLSQALMLIRISLSKLNHLSLATSQRVLRLLERGKNRKHIGRATLHWSASIRLMLHFSFWSRCVPHVLLGCAKPLVWVRLSLCLWPGSTTMRYPV